MENLNCNSCDFCDFCNYCQNLKFTEYNIFCYSEKFGDKNSVRQAPYRAFNQEVEKERCFEIFKEVRDIIHNSKNLKLKYFWESITQEQWAKLLKIKEAKDFKKGFEFISGVEIKK